MKRIIRIPFGIVLCPFPLLIGTWMWLWGDEDNWLEEVGLTTWWIASGQWNKLPD